MFPNNNLINSVDDRSDHSLLWLQLWEHMRRGYPKPFRFENAWLEEDDLSIVVGDSLSRVEGHDFTSRVESCTADIDLWGRKLRMRY